ncbi:VWA domain-containing protein [Aureitalea marina]|uniref:VWA domain-containing protein n=1 Tax=Aureitalea marina TaxID=930804 RepID=A0A2S7KN75_9FLAO|nr:VWA domain-containing protein [Aureitalea marina]PQB04084.1 VWA domain-containing protein [Aureitalea marina]
MKSILRTTVVMLLISLMAHAQQFELKGKVIDDLSFPLPGTNIYKKAAKDGVQSDVDGNYSIVVQVGDTIHFAYVGFKTQKHLITGKMNRLDVAMMIDETELEEVLVTAGGVRKESKALGYAVSAVSAEDLSIRPAGEVARVLQGKASGVQITAQSGTAGSATNVQIRGYSSMSGTNQALIVVDGIPVIRDAKNAINKLSGNIDASELINIDPDQIADVNVLKGMAAATLYGTAARNGVIVINTKSGQVGKQLSPYYDQESYARIIENQYKYVSASPLSTFSIDVDKAGYSNVRRMINNGQDIPPDAVKLEEMINYFQYDYPQPASDEVFSITTDIANSPWNPDAKLVRIGLKGKEISLEQAPASNLVFLIDVSGSMSDHNKLPLVKRSLELLVSKLRPADRVSMVVYAGAAGVVLEPTTGDEKQEILDALNRLEAGGSTAGGEGIALAYELAEKHFVKDGNNRVILATDGDFNVGPSSDEDMEDLIVNKRKSGVFLTVLGYGMGNYKDSKMETLADKGNGNHAYIDGMQEASRVFGTELMGTIYTIAKDVKIQVEFNPARVQAYRLVGYENRLLADEDFTNDKKDAGELGSGHTVTALYELIPVGVKSKLIPLLEPFTYTSGKESANKKDWLTVKFRYKAPDGEKSKLLVQALDSEAVPFEQASADFRFAASVALFGMQLRKSIYIDQQNSDEVVRIARSSISEDPDGYRAEFIRLVESYQ